MAYYSISICLITEFVSYFEATTFVEPTNIWNATVLNYVLVELLMKMLDFLVWLTKTVLILAHSFKFHLFLRPIPTIQSSSTIPQHNW